MRKRLQTRASAGNIFNLLILMYGMSLPFESITLGSVGTLPYIPAAGLITSAVLAAIHPHAQRDGRLFHPLLIVGPLALSAVSVLWSMNISDTFGRIITLTGLVLVSIAIISTGDETSLRCGLYGLVIGGALSAAYIVANYSQRNTSMLEIRVTAVDANANDLAGMAAAAGVVAIAISISSHSRRHRIALALVGFWILFGVLLTASRGPLLSAVAALAAVLMMASHNRLKVVARIVVAMASGVTLIRLIDPRIMTRLQTTFPALTNGDLNGRQDFWHSGLQAWADQPLTGSGAGTFVAALTRHGDYAGAAHSAFIDVLAETGIIGLVLLLSAFGAAVRAAVRARAFKLELTALIVAIFVNCIDLSWDYRKIAWFAIALCFLAGRLSLSRARSEGGGSNAKA